MDIEKWKDDLLDAELRRLAWRRTGDYTGRRLLCMLSGVLLIFSSTWLGSVMWPAGLAALLTAAPSDWRLSLLLVGWDILCFMPGLLYMTLVLDKRQNAEYQRNLKKLRATYIDAGEA